MVYGSTPKVQDPKDTAPKVPEEEERIRSQTYSRLSSLGFKV